MNGNHWPTGGMVVVTFSTCFLGQFDALSFRSAVSPFKPEARSLLPVSD